MDTPDRPQNPNPGSKFEDSPVFNYINSLSPIQPVKSIHIAQTFNSLNFSSPPSVFTSPHVCPQRESRFLKRNFFLSSLKRGLPSDDELRGTTSEAVSDAGEVPDCSADPRKSVDRCSIREVNVDKENENVELAIELPRTLKYDCGSPECNTGPSHGIKVDAMPVASDISAKHVQFSEQVLVESHLSAQIEVEDGVCEVDRSKEDGTGCDWEKLISDASDLLVFDSANNSEPSGIDNQNTEGLDSSSCHSLALPKEDTNDVHIRQPLLKTGPCRDPDVGDSATQSSVEEHKETNHTPDVLSSVILNKKQVTFTSEIVDDKAGNHIPFGCEQRGIRRRCLVFETAGARKRKLDDYSNSSSSASSHSDGKYVTDDKQLVSLRPCTTSSPCMVPGIGLHLNALAATTKDSRVVKHEALDSSKESISIPCSLSSLHSLSSEQKPLNKSLFLSSTNADMFPSGNDVQGMLDASRVSAFRVVEDYNESSPKKKRRREHGGENEACKRCNCKKSKCLKLYCECFAAGVYCVEPCSCQECFNKPVHEDTVLATRKQIESRNPLAFAPKVIRSSDSVSEIGEESNKTPASARHKRGCNCRKSNCLKKYCECYQGGVGCSINCRCGGCKNKFGRKDGSTPIGFAEAEPEEEETEAGDKNGFDGSLQNKVIQTNEEQCPDNILPMTFPFQICRTSVQLPLSSFGKPPRYSLPTQPNYEKHFQIMTEDETHDILGGNSSPIRCFKTASPNSKRVSPPHREFSSSPRRNGRKLVLQSIPSFPPLTQPEMGDFH